MTIQIKATEQHFLWYCLLCFARWFYLLRLRTKPLCVTIYMNAIEQCFHVVLFIMLYKVVLTFESVDKTLVFDHSNESY